MSSSWTERQGQVGDLRNKTKEELLELLSRQEKLLSNKRFAQTLPDKGRKISEFADRVRLALAHHAEEERKRDKLSSIRSELQSKYQQALTQRPPALTHTPGDPQESRDRQDDAAVSGLSAAVAMETSPAGAGAGASRNPDRTREGDLAEALQRVSLSDPASAGSRGSSRDTTSHRSPPPPPPAAATNTNSLFSGKQPQKKPHYIEVLERTEKNPETRNHKFRPNQLRAPRTDSSPSGSPSPSDRSPGGSLSPSSPLSTEARRERDRKHLDDITSARLPPLHHSPARLLSLDESAFLVKEQTRKELELQAKLAAQKLSEGPGISMGSFSPPRGPLAAYRQVHDHGAQLSSDED